MRSDDNGLTLSDPTSADLRLRSERVTTANGATPSDRPAGLLLGERRHDLVEPADRAMPAVLAPSAACVTDRWWLTAPGHPQSPPPDSLGCVTYRRVGPWLHATAVVDDSALPGGLQKAAERLYRDLFQVLQRESRTDGVAALHVLKVWNYMADINGIDPTSGLERYRLFNIGRQDAFLTMGHAAFEGAPAACALGTHQGPLTVHLLAGPRAPRTVENPRQVSAYRYPADYGPRAPTFSRAALVDVGEDWEALFISGTASIVGHRSLHPGDVAAQTRETLANIEALLAAASAHQRADHGLADLELTVYLRHPQDLDTVRDVLARHLTPSRAATLDQALFLCADVCRSELLVEIEAQSLRPATRPTPEPRTGSDDVSP